MTSTRTAEYTIGALATAAGVNVETIRYYQRIGLIMEPAKPTHGFRKYPQDSLEQLLFIKRAQQLGFALHEVAELLALGEGRCQDVRQRAEQKRDKIERQIRDLRALSNTLTELIDACQQGAEKQSCPIVTTLLTHPQNP